MLKDDELTGKYIKYSPEITEEIFDKIIRSLNSSNCTWYKGSSTPLTLANFKKFGFVKIYKDKDYAITATGEDIEISYKDIISEDEWWKSLKKGDYVVTIKSSGGGYPANHIFKIKSYSSKSYNSKSYSSRVIYTELDINGSTANGWGHNNFRIATPDEVKMYKHAGKPVDVTTYVISKESIPAFEEGKWYKGEEGRYMKFSHLVPEKGYNSLYYTEKIYQGNHMVSSNYWANNAFERYMIDNPVDLSEIQQYLPDGHPDKIVKDSSWCVIITDENRKVAKKYFTDFKTNTFNEGAKYGINKNGKQGYITDNVHKWGLSKDTPVISTEEFYKKIGHSVELVKSFQVHDKCNIGDIIVSLEPQSRTVTSRRNGDLLRVLEKSIKEKLYYSDSFSILQENSNTYRLATPQEIQLFNQGIKNIYNVKKEDKFEVNKWYIYSTKSMLSCYQGSGKGYGLINNLSKWSDNISMTDDYWVEATNKQVEDALLTYAEQKYPIGTKFKSISLNNFKNKYTVTKKLYNQGGGITHFGIDWVYLEGKWAEIIENSKLPVDISPWEVRVFPETELILNDDDDVIFPNIKIERITRAKLLVD